MTKEQSKYWKRLQIIWLIFEQAIARPAELVNGQDERRMRAAVARPICLCWQAIIRVWETPKIEKWRFVLFAGTPFFCKCTYTCCACYSLKSQSPALLECVFYANTNTFFAVNLDSNTCS